MDLTQLIGNFHPVLVHLPIGFLLLAVVLQLLARNEKYASLQNAISIAFLLGTISALLSCITGWTLASGGDYDETTLFWHRWLGLAVAFISSVGYIFSKNSLNKTKTVIAIILSLLIFITGHLGGTLTHGEGFLTKGFQSNTDSAKSTRKTIANVQEAMVFDDIIQPMLKDKCTGCHNANKQKGGLRLDGKDWILKGGKDGKVLDIGKAEASELYKRVVMDPLEEKHMPPKGKTPLTEQEIALLHWWISSNAGFDKKVKEISQPDLIKPALMAMQSAATTMKKPMIPDATVESAKTVDLEAMQKAGIIVLPVAVNSNYLSANFVSIQKVDEQTIALLKPIKKQLVWLKLGYAELSNNSWKTIGECTQLTRLSIEHTNLTDDNIKELAKLNNLQYLNLVGTRVSAKGIQELKGIAKLESIYLGQTGVKSSDYQTLRSVFPKSVIDSGNYHVENLVTDTQLLKAPVVKK